MNGTAESTITSGTVGRQFFGLRLQPSFWYVVTALSLIIFYELYVHLLTKPIPGIPYNKGAANSLFGDMPSLAQHAAATGEPMDWFRQQAEKHRPSPLCQVFVRPFAKPFVLLSDFRELQALMLTRAKDFDRSRLFRDILGGAGVHHHILKKTDADWRAQRKLLNDLMTPAFLHNVAAPHVCNAIGNIIELWEAKARIAEGRPFNIELDAYYLALDAVVAFSYGDSYTERALLPQISLLNSIDHRQISALRATTDGVDDPIAFPEAKVHAALAATLTMVQMTDQLQSSVVPSFTWWWLGKTPKIRKAWSTRDKFVAGEIEKAVGRMQGQGDDESWMRSAVDLIVSRVRQFAAKEGQTPQYLSPMIIEEVFGFTMAGHESSSSTLIWALKYLTNNPEVQNKLRKSLHEAHRVAYGEKRAPAVAEIIHTQIPYLDAVMDEVLRLGTPIPFLARDAEKDTEILGFQIPKGTVVFAHSLGPSMMTPSVAGVNDKQRDPASEGFKTGEWNPEDIGQFRPERWLKETIDPSTGETVTSYDPNSGPFMAFGLGVRGCFGRRLGLFELRNSLTLLIWNFEFLPVPCALSGYSARDGLTRRPKDAFIRLGKVVY